MLRETFGVIVYQEQVMEAARRLCRLLARRGRPLRRAMGKKIRSEMEAQRKRFVEGAVKDGVEKGQAEAIFELLDASPTTASTRATRRPTRSSPTRPPT